MQGSILIPSLIASFKNEFEDLLKTPSPHPPKVVLPKIVDYEKKTSKFILKEDSHEGIAPSSHKHQGPFIDRQNYSR